MGIRIHGGHDHWSIADGRDVLGRRPTQSIRRTHALQCHESRAERGAGGGQQGEREKERERDRNRERGGVGEEAKVIEF